MAEVRFAETINAVGTALANEQVTLSAPVTERIIRLNFDDGAFVQRGQVIAVLQQAQQTAQLSEVQARAREAEQQLERVGELKDRGFATRSSFDSQVANAASARAQAQAVQASISDRVITAPFAGWVSLRPRQYDTIAIVHRAGAALSPAARLMIELATARIQAIADPVHPH